MAEEAEQRREPHRECLPRHAGRSIYLASQGPRPPLGGLRLPYERVTAPLRPQKDEGADRQEGVAEESEQQREPCRERLPRYAGMPII